MLPNHLKIPAVTAASVAFEPHLTARDISILVSVSWVAGQAEATGTVDIPDFELRRDLGDLRRTDEVREGARYTRLDSSVVTADERLDDLRDGVPVPTVQPGMRRVLIDGAYRWIIDAAIVDAFKVMPGDDAVEIPLNLLARARSRFSLPLAMRLLAWQSGDVDRKWIRRQTSAALHLRIPIADMRAAIGADSAIEPSNLWQYAIEPAIREITTLTDIYVTAELVRAPSTRARGGRVIAIDLSVGRLTTDSTIKPSHRPKSPTLAATTPTAVIVPLRRIGQRPNRPAVLPSDGDGDVF